MFLSKLLRPSTVLLHLMMMTTYCWAGGRHSRDEADLLPRPLGLEGGDAASRGRLCKTETKTVELKSNGLYEYRPRFYTEVRCQNALLDGADIFVDSRNGHCSTLNMHCVQQYRVIELMHRRTDDTNLCWEPAIMEIKIPYGCECMFPHDQIRFSRRSDFSF